MTGDVVQAKRIELVNDQGDLTIVLDGGGSEGGGIPASLCTALTDLVRTWPSMLNGTAASLPSPWRPPPADTSASASCVAVPSRR